MLCTCQSIPSRQSAHIMVFPTVVLQFISQWHILVPPALNAIEVQMTKHECHYQVQIFSLPKRCWTNFDPHLTRLKSLLPLIQHILQGHPCPGGEYVPMWLAYLTMVLVGITWCTVMQEVISKVVNTVVQGWRVVCGCWWEDTQVSLCWTMAWMVRYICTVGILATGEEYYFDCELQWVVGWSGRLRPAVGWTRSAAQTRPCRPTGSSMPAMRTGSWPQ